jgi:hypothetical protein
LWCGGGHLHKDCPEKDNVTSTPACCNCQLAEGEKPHPANYRGCKLAKEEMRKRKPQGAPKPTSGRVFSSNPVKPTLSFAAALRGQAASRPRPRPQPEPEPEAATRPSQAPAPSPEPLTGQSVQATHVNSDTEMMFLAYAKAEQIMHSQTVGS